MKFKNIIINYLKYIKYFFHFFHFQDIINKYLEKNDYLKIIHYLNEKNKRIC
jgi:hypothetical protein